MKELVASILGVSQIHDDDSFISLGGDSLNYVRAWLVLEEHLGRCPDGWEGMSLADLDKAYQTYVHVIAFDKFNEQWQS